MPNIYVEFELMTSRNIFTCVSARVRMNHCFKYRFSTTAPDRHDRPVSSICSSARTV